VSLTHTEWNKPALRCFRAYATGVSPAFVDRSVSSGERGASKVPSRSCDFRRSTRLLDGYFGVGSIRKKLTTQSAFGSYKESLKEFSKSKRSSS
jgi:hypothetical protein